MLLHERKNPLDPNRKQSVLYTAHKTSATSIASNECFRQQSLLGRLYRYRIYPISIRLAASAAASLGDIAVIAIGQDINSVLWSATSLPEIARLPAMRCFVTQTQKNVHRKHVHKNDLG